MTTPNNKKIIIAVSNDLSTDQRVLKVAKSLSENGYDVLLTGRRLKNSLTLNSAIQNKRFSLIFNRGFLFYAELNIRLFLFLLGKNADILYANDTDTLPACFLAAGIKHKKLVFDAHELFPEVPELQDRPRIKRCWTKIEDLIFPRLTTAITVCESIATYYRQKYKLNMHVIRNVPYLQEVNPKKIVIPGKKIILYQGAVNMGRGLEWVIDAMPYIENAVLYIIGDGDILTRLIQRVIDQKLDSKVIFHGKIPAEELQPYTSSGDIGLCLLENKGLNYYYALPNRVFSYLHAYVPILASPFPEISAIVEKHNTGKLTSETYPEKLAGIINEMLENPLNTSHFEKVKKLYCWEEEEKILLQLINSL
jgi:glycosyltransferase involved in cell wall biosynthesis